MSGSTVVTVQICWQKANVDPKQGTLCALHSWLNKNTNSEPRRNTMEYGILGLIILIADIYAIVQVFGSSTSAMSKVLWILGILIFPVVGFIVWLIAGPRSGSVRA